MVELDLLKGARISQVATMVRLVKQPTNTDESCQKADVCQFLACYVYALLTAMVAFHIIQSCS